MRKFHYFECLINLHRQCKGNHRINVFIIIFLFLFAISLVSYYCIVIPNCLVNLRLVQQANFSRNITAYINKKTYKIPPSGPIECDSATVLIGVISAPKNQNAREAIRKQWKFAEKKLPKRKIKLLFVIGEILDNKLENKITAENFQNRDILQLNMLDSYQNLTLKVMALINWTNKNCNQTKFLIKSDDDVYINDKNMIRFIECVNTHLYEHYKNVSKECQVYNPKKIIGHYFDASNGKYTSYLAAGYLFSVIPPNRDPNSKYFLDSKYYPDSILPPILSGTSYILTTNLLPLILDASKHELLVPLEDVYITGFLLSRNIGIRLSHIEGWSNYRPQFDDRCLFKDLLTLHGLTWSELKYISNEMNELNPEEECGPFRKFLSDINKLISSYIPRYPP